MRAADGKMRITDVATAEQMFRVIQSIPSPKAEPFKMWMAKVAAERIDQTAEDIAQRRSEGETDRKVDAALNDDAAKGMKLLADLINQSKLAATQAIQALRVPQDSPEPLDWSLRLRRNDAEIAGINWRARLPGIAPKHLYKAKHGVSQAITRRDIGARECCQCCQCQCQLPILIWGSGKRGARDLFNHGILGTHGRFCVFRG